MSHAELSPSSASRWVACPGSVALTRGLPDTSSAAADEGTDAHTLAARCLTEGTDAAAYLGETLPLGSVVDRDMAGYVQAFVNTVRHTATSLGGPAIQVEKRVGIEAWTGEPDAHGTADVVLVGSTELVVIDLKYGMGVQVFATNNLQLALYALPVLDRYSLIRDIETVRLVIHQPRLHHLDEWTIPAAKLLEIGEMLKAAAERTRQPDAPLVPGESQCKFCRAAGTCPAIRAAVESEFETVADVKAADDDTLSTAMAKAGLVETWVKAVRAEVEWRLLDGTPVAGWKLVQGKRGHRKWADEAEAEATLKRMRMKRDVMYEASIISPTTAEKLYKDGVISAGRWPILQKLIIQPEGGPSVAPVTDPRPVYKQASVEDFDDVASQAGDASDLI